MPGSLPELLLIGGCKWCRLCSGAASNQSTSSACVICRGEIKGGWAGYARTQLRQTAKRNMHRPVREGLRVLALLP